MNVPSRLDIALGATGLEAGAKIAILSHMDIRNDIKTAILAYFCPPEKLAQDWIISWRHPKG